MIDDDNQANEYQYSNTPRLFTIFIIVIIITVFISNFANLNLTNIPELEIYNNQTLQLLLPSKKCKYISHGTLFFTSNFRNNSKELKEQYNIIDYKNTKNSFVTYYMGDEEYEQYIELFSNHGLIKSDNIYADHNFFLSKRALSLVRRNISLMNINNFKKFYRFFGYQVLLKDALYMNYMEIKKEFNEEYNFMPETYYYPKDKDIIEKKFRNYTLNIDDLWFVKPTHKWGGVGITIFNSLDTIDKEEYLINKYITNLDLINNKKYDLRLYVLVTGLKPLRIYLNKDGLIRIASRNFTLKQKKLKDKYIHLTNTGVNSRSADFIIPNSTENEKANIWNFHTYENYLNRINVNYTMLRDKIKDIIIKSMVSVYQNLTSELSQNNLNDINFYDVLGYDIIITDQHEPILLEINSGPSIVMYNELDKSIKTNLLVDTLNIIGISPFSKNILFKKRYKAVNTVEDNVNNAFCELERPKGDYELIFPLKDNIDIYKNLFRNRNNKENELFWEKIIKGG